MSRIKTINEQVTEYVEGFYSPLDEQLGSLRRRAEANEIPIILRDTERFLVTLIHMMRPSRILEVGTAVGYSAACMARTAGKDAEIVTLEKNPLMAGAAKENLRNLGYDSQVTILTGDAAETLASIEGIFDLVFIDAAKSHYGKYWDMIMPHCRPGSLIVCDNILLHGAITPDGYEATSKRHRTSIRRMWAFTEKITTDPNVETSLMTVGDGLSLSYVKKVENV